MPDITFTNNETFTPSLSLTGTIRGRALRVYLPELNGDVVVLGRLTLRIPQPQPISPLAGQLAIQGTFTGNVNQPAAAFTDFSHYPYGGTDPVMAMTGASSGGLMSGATGTYTRPYATFTAPRNYPVSGGTYAWKRAAYAAVGFKFSNMTANKHQILDAVQLETRPVGTETPSVYQTARSLKVLVKPTRLNYATNPSMETSIAGYSALGTATLVSDTFCWRGSRALKTTVAAGAASDSGISFPVSGLVIGTWYTLSMRVSVAQDCGTVYPWVSANSGTLITRKSFTVAEIDPANRNWRTLSMTFVATANTTYVGLNVAKESMPPGKSSIFWSDGVLVEEGTLVGSYFDGSMGADYLWDSSGTPNLTRSYFYENRVERGYLIKTLLSENTPLGIISAVPQYAVLPNQ